MNISNILSFLLEHIDVIISAVIGLLGGMQIEKIIIKNSIKNSPGSSIYNGDINASENKKWN